MDKCCLSTSWWSRSCTLSSENCVALGVFWEACRPRLALNTLTVASIGLRLSKCVYWSLEKSYFLLHSGNTGQSGSASSNPYWCKNLMTHNIFLEEGVGGRMLLCCLAAFRWFHFLWSLWRLISQQNTAVYNVGRKDFTDLESCHRSHIILYLLTLVMSQTEEMVRSHYKGMLTWNNVSCKCLIRTPLWNGRGW